VGQEGSCCSIFRFLCGALYIIVCPFVTLRLIIMFSVFLRFTVSDYPYGMFNLLVSTKIVYPGSIYCNEMSNEMHLCVRISVLPCSAILIFDCGIVLYVLFLILLLIIGVVN
jgi:hypothetical protein